MKKLYFFLALYCLSFQAKGQQWEIIEIDNGIKPSIALNQSNTPFIAYMNEKVGGFIRVAEQDEDSFQISNIDEGYFYGPLDIAIDNVGHPRVSFHDHNREDAILMVRNTSGWFKHVIMSTNHDGWDATVAIDEFNGSHVASVDPSNGLEYASFNNGMWTVENPNTGGFMYRHGTSIVLTDNNLPYIAYYKDNMDRLELAKKNGNSWELGLVDTGGRFPSMVLDENDNPIIAYYKKMSGPIGEVKVATYNNGMWEREVIDTLNDVELTFSGARNVVSLDIGPEGNLHLSYGDKYRVFYAKKEDDNWAIQNVVDVDGLGITLGQQTSLAIDGFGFAHLTYFERTSANQDGGIIKYAQNQNLFMFLIACPPEALVVCEMNPDTSVTGLPEILNNPGDSVNYNYTDLIKTSGCGNAPDTIERHWMVSNEFGNFDQCTQIILSEHYDRDQTIFPAEFNYSEECFFYPTSNQTGNIDDLCLNIISSFEDSLITTTCQADVTIRRRWYIEDWCQIQLDSFDQLIHFNDHEELRLSTFIIIPDNGTSTGSISFNTNCGVAPYEYLWHTGSTASSLQNLAEGDYSLTVTDAIGCEVTMLLTVPGPEPFTSISGFARDVDNQILSDITPNLNFLGGTNYPYEACDPDPGANYSICFDSPGSVMGDMELCLDKEDEAANGTSGLDVVKAQRIILGLVNPCPFNVIAADVNQDGSVSGSDLVLMSRVILGLNSEFPNNVSWRFFLEGTEFPEGQFPLDILEENECAQLSANELPVANLDFTGIKLGDLDCQDDPLFNGSNESSDPRDRNIAKITLQKPDNNKEINLFLDNMENITVGQFAFDLSDTELEIASLKLNPIYESSNVRFDYFIQDQSLKILLLHPQGILLDQEQYLIKITGNEKPIDNVKLLTDVTWSHEMVDGHGISFSIELHIETVKNEGLESISIHPNPFNLETLLVISSGDPVHEAELIIYTVHGQKIFEKNIHLFEGKNELPISGELFRTSGTYLIQLISNDMVHSAKIIYIQ